MSAETAMGFCWSLLMHLSCSCVQYRCIHLTTKACVPMQVKLGMPLPHTLVYDYPTVSAIAMYASSVAVAHAPSVDSDEDADVDDRNLAVQVAPVTTALPGTIKTQYEAAGQQLAAAVVGMASNIPGGQGWGCLLGLDAACRTPLSRWCNDEQEHVSIWMIRIMAVLLLCMPAVRDANAQS